MSDMDRRGFIKLAGLGGGIVFASSLGLNTLGSVLDYANNYGGKKVEKEFYFVQLSDTHWGFSGPKVNPDADGTLKKAVQVVNSLEEQPDFIVFTGDLTHTTDDVQVRKDRMAQFKDIVGQLKVPTVHFMAGEHDASLDRGDAYQQFFGKLNYTFDHKGVHFIVLDNVSDPGAMVGARCHSTPAGNPSVYGQSFYPPAPQLLGGMSDYTDSQLFSLIKHGVRNTGMPAWGAMLSDDEIWQIVSLLKNSQDLPPSVESEWQAPKNTAAP
jgi:hypothetical protein